MFKLHFSRAIKNRTSRITFLLVLLIHVGLVTFDILSSVCEPINFLYDFPGYILGFGSDMRYRNFFEVNEFYIHLLILFVAILPYASSFFTDRELGTLNNLFTRTERRYYLYTGLTVNFVVSFMTYFIPRMISVTMLAFAFPLQNLKIGYSNFYNVGADFEFVSGFKTLLLYQPYIYFFIYALIGALFVALFSSIVYAFSLHVKINKYVVLILPVLLMFIIDALMEICFGMQFVPSNIIFSSETIFSPKINYGMSLISVFAFEIIIFLTLLFTGIKRNKDVF